MHDVSLRELRSNTAAVLRRVEAGERLCVTAISVITLAALELGVHMAAAEALRGWRLRALQAARSTYVALPVDDAVASASAELVAIARRAGRRPRSR